MLKINFKKNIIYYNDKTVSETDTEDLGRNNQITTILFENSPIFDGIF